MSLSVEALLGGRAHLVNIGTGTPTSVMEMHAAYEAACGRALPYEVLDRRPGDVPRLDADPRLARVVLGFEARLDLADMCRDSWRWVRAQASGWRLNDPD